MPFAGYEDFAACVAANGDKDDPKAYCGALEAAHKAHLKGAFRLAKLDDERRLVFGWASVAVTKDGQTVVDLQDDMIATEALELAAYRYVLKGRRANAMHAGADIGELVESVMFTAAKRRAMGLADGTVPDGWWVGYYIADPAMYAKVKAGEFRAFSIEGRAERRAA